MFEDMRDPHGGRLVHMLATRARSAERVDGGCRRRHDVPRLLDAQRSPLREALVRRRRPSRTATGARGDASRARILYALSATFTVKGDNAYGILKAERGKHRLVRQSPFDSAHRRHTSFAQVIVAPLLEEAGDIVIDDDDIRIDTFRASGAGGQHVNKTDSAVRITHMPSNIVVSVQNERSQTANKDTAMKILRSRLAEKAVEEREAELARERGGVNMGFGGTAVRSYFLHPYQLVKDHRTDFEVGNAQGVLDGNLDGFIRAYLLQAAGQAAGNGS